MVFSSGGEVPGQQRAGRLTRERIPFRPILTDKFPGQINVLNVIKRNDHTERNSIGREFSEK